MEKSGQVDFSWELLAKKGRSTQFSRDQALDFCAKQDSKGLFEALCAASCSLATSNSYHNVGIQLIGACLRFDKRRTLDFWRPGGAPEKAFRLAMLEFEMARAAAAASCGSEALSLNSFTFLTAEQQELRQFSHFAADAAKASSISEPLWLLASKALPPATHVDAVESSENPCAAAFLKILEAFDEEPILARQREEWKRSALSSSLLCMGHPKLFKSLQTSMGPIGFGLPSSAISDVQNLFTRTGQFDPEEKAKNPWRWRVRKEAIDAASKNMSGSISKWLGSLSPQEQKMAAQSLLGADWTANPGPAASRFFKWAASIKGIESTSLCLALLKAANGECSPSHPIQMAWDGLFLEIKSSKAPELFMELGRLLPNPEKEAAALAAMTPKSRSLCEKELLARAAPVEERAAPNAKRL